MHYYLQGKEIQFPIELGRTTIGRQSNSNIRVTFSCVDLLQCVIVKDESGNLTLENLAPNNSTQYNNFPLSFNEVRNLQNGDVIRIGLTYKRQYMDFKICTGKPALNLNQTSYTNDNQLEAKCVSNRDDSSSVTIIDDGTGFIVSKAISVESDSSSKDTDILYPRAPFSQVAIKNTSKRIDKVTSMDNEPTTSAIKNKSAVSKQNNNSYNNPHLRADFKKNPLGPASDKENETTCVLNPAVEIEETDEEKSELGDAHVGDRKRLQLKPLDSSSSDDETVHLTVKKRNVILSDKESGSSLSPGNTDSETDEEQEGNSQSTATKESYHSSTQTTVTSQNSSSSESVGLLRKKRKRREEIVWPSRKERLKKTYKTFMRMHKLCDE